MNKHLYGEQGFIGLYLTIVVLTLMLGIIISIGSGVLAQQSIIQNTMQSAQAYAAAESGVEDALLRLRVGMTICSPQPCTYALVVADATTNVTIGDLIGSGRRLVGEGSALDRVRKTEVVYELSSTGVGFFYGAQVGDAGIELFNSSKIIGNIFSNGDFVHANTAQITGTVQIAGAGNKIRGDADGSIEVGVDAYADICEDSDITGDFYGLSHSGCTFSSFILQSPPSPIPFPISSAQIDAWKLEADVGVPIGDYTRNSGISTLGPQKIIGNLTIENTAQLIMTGTLWVTGNVTIKNSAKVNLDAGYGSTSGIIVADGIITLENTSASSGSGQTGSYLMYLSTSSVDPALIIKNFAVVDILYTNNGFTQIENNVDVREVTAYGVRLTQTAELTYEIGLANAEFTSGPEGGWTVTSWKEIE